MKFQKSSVLASFGVAAVVALSMQVACDRGGGSERTARGSAVVVDRASQNLRFEDIESLNGTYGSECDSSAGMGWRLPVGDNNSSIPPLQIPAVTTGDTDCQLTLTSVTGEDNSTYEAGTAANGSFTPDTNGAGIPLGPSFGSAPIAFGTATEGVAFYANARLSDPGFASDFSVTFIFSDDPAQAGGSIVATVLTVASVSADEVAAPNYTYSDSESTLEVETNTEHVVQNVNGDVVLTSVDLSGKAYVLTQAADTSTFAEVDAIFTAAQTPTPIPFPGGSVTIPEASIEPLLVGDDLDVPTTVKVVIQRGIHDLVQGKAPYDDGGVTAYQVITLSITAPTTCIAPFVPDANGGCECAPFWIPSGNTCIPPTD